MCGVLHNLFFSYTWLESEQESNKLHLAKSLPNISGYICGISEHYSNMLLYVISDMPNTKKIGKKRRCKHQQQLDNNHVLRLKHAQRLRVYCRVLQLTGQNNFCNPWCTWWDWSLALFSGSQSSVTSGITGLTEELRIKKLPKKSHLKSQPLTNLIYRSSHLVTYSNQLPVLVQQHI